MPLRHLFLFIGADPNADWLKDCVAVDDKGFVVTGDGLRRGDADRAPLPLETSMPGVFAIGDVRAGSTKRVGAAIGEGARWWRRSTGAGVYVLALEGWLAWVDTSLKSSKLFHAGSGGSGRGMIDRRLGELHLWDVAWAIREDRARGQRAP